MYTVCRRLRVNYLQAILGTEQQLRVGGGGGAGRREVVEPESTCYLLNGFLYKKRHFFVRQSPRFSFLHVCESV